MKNHETHSFELKASKDGRVSLETFALSKDDEVHVEAKPGAGYRVTIDGKSGSSIRVTTAGPAEVTTDGIIEQLKDGSVFRSVTCIAPAGDPVTLDIEPKTTSSAMISGPIDVSSLTFERDDIYRNGTETIPRTISAVVAATVTLRDIADSQLKVLRAEYVTMSITHGMLKTIGRSDSLLSLEFQGEVKDLTTAFGEQTKARMPSYLEWIKANAGISAVWAAVLWVFGVIMAVGKCWKGQP